MKLRWYFDFISPFAYLQLCQFDRLPDSVEVEYRPILFAGLLNHWKNVGPAEIEPKRIFTYKHCYWLAKKNNIPFRMPPTHPFNSLSALRLTIAVGCNRQTVQTIFECIWKDGLSLDSRQAIEQLEKQLAVTDLLSLLGNQTVKDTLRANTEAAATDSVFGVPTFISLDGNKELFWGQDSFDMLLDYIDDPKAFNDSEMQRISSLPVGIQRKR